MPCGASFRKAGAEASGADADHLKTTADMDACLGAGYTFFTIDPGDHVDNSAETATLSELRAAAEKLPADIRPSASGLESQVVRH